MECLCGLASSISSDLVRGALNQLRYPCCFNDLVKQLEKEEGDLIVTRDSVQDFVEYAKKQTKKTNDDVNKWLQDAISDVDNVNQLLEEARKKKSFCFGHCPNWIGRYRVGKKLANETLKLQKVIKDGKEFKVPLDRIATLNPSNTLDMLSEKCVNFESRQPAFVELLEAVKNDDVAMIGLYGMGGCGKTTLAMEVRKVVEAEHLFDKVLFVPVSSTVEVRRIQDKIASSLQYTFPENEEMERSQRLCSRLTQEKKILMILDDVWEKLDFGRIGIPSSEHHKGCKILITTRLEEVCTSMDCQRKIYLPILKDEEAWTLFQNKALISEGTPDTVKHLARLISDECKGLPVVIAAVACSLKGKAEAIWSVALNKLRSSKPVDIGRGLTDPYKCLQLSYDNLDTEEAKSLFLLCSAFPEDFEIPVEILTRCAIGLGVVGEAHSYEEARSEVIAAKIKLVSSCLLSDEDDECVKMHDILRDVAHWIAKNENKVIKCELEKDVTLEKTSVRYLWCEKIPNDMDCSNLEFLYLETNLEELDEILKRMRMLRVLILTNEEDEIVPLSTMSFKTLTNLRCLILSNSELSDFSFLRDMTKLQSLSFFECSLPSFLELQIDAAVIQLTALKFLEFNRCFIEKKNFEVIKRTPLLEELNILDIKGEWKSDSEDTIEFFNTFSVPQTLQRYRIVLRSNYFCEYDKDKLYVSDRTLLFNNFHISNEVIKGLAKKAKELFVANIEGGAKGIIPDIFQIEGECMNELNKLEICNSKEIEYLIDTSNHNHLSEVRSLFSKLHTLRINKMEHLRVLWYGFPPAKGPFGNLKKLYLSDCPLLTSLFTYVMARNLVQLKILKILRCDGLKYILADDDKTEKHKDGFTTGHPVQFVIFQNLEEVQVCGCRELKHIFSANIVGGLTQLKELEIEDCDMLDQIIGDIVPLAYPGKKEEIDEIIEEGMHPHLYSSHLESNQLHFFTENTFIPSTAVVNHSSGILSGLASLTISSCSKLGSIFTISIAKNLTSLEKLIIEYCHGLKHIVTHERVNKNQKAADLKDFSSRNNFKDIWNAIFPNLKELSVMYCDQLEYILGQYPVANQDYKEIHIHFPALETLHLYFLPNFVNIGDTNVLSVTWPSLKEFICDGCINCLTVPMDSREPISRSEKDPKGIQNHFLALQTLRVRNAEVKGIFCLNGHQMIEQQVSLMLEELDLKNLPQMTYIWVASKNSVTLQHLKTLEIVGCAKLEVIFPPSILRSLPELQRLIIKECIELKQIMEEDKEDKKLSNHLSTQPCFPKLEMLSVEKCHKLKGLFYSSNDFPNLKSLTINGASELEQIVGCEEGASKNSLTFHNLKILKIIESAKLEVIFPKSVLSCLPELNHLEIRKCKELRQIISEDVEDKKMSNLISPQPCFPKLETLLVEECHKLKRIFSGSASNDLPSLHVLIINGASELEVLIGCEQGEHDEIRKTKVELPRLKILIFMDLSNFRQEIESLNVKYCIVCECPKLSLTSTTTFEKLRDDFPHEDFANAEVIGWDVYQFIRHLHIDFICSGSNELSSSQINENSKMEYIEKDSGSEVLNIATSMNSEYNELSSLSPLDIRQHSQEIGNVGNESMEEVPAAEVAKTKSLPTGVEDIGIGGGIVTHIESSGKVVEQDDKMSEGKTRIVASQETKVQEGLNLLDYHEGIDIVSNSNIGFPPAYADIRTRLGAYKNFVDLDDAQITLLVEAITTYPHLWNTCEKFTKRFQAWSLKILADMLLFLQNESVDRVIPQREKEFHKLCDEAAEIGFESSWVDEMRQRIREKDLELGKDIVQRQIDENSKRSSGEDMVPDSQVVEQGDEPNENWKGTSPSPKIQNVNSSFQEGEISVVSNDRIVAPRNEDPKKEFTAKESTLDIPRIETSLINSQPDERPSPSYLNIPQTHSYGLVDKQWISEPCLLKQEQPLEEIISTREIPQSIKRVGVEETIAKNTSMAASSTHSVSACSQLDQLVTSQSISHPHNEIRSSQTKESEAHPKINQDFGANDITSLFAPVAVEKEGEDNRVGKTLDELRRYLKMPLEDIVSSETNSLRLLTALNFLSNLPFKDVTLSGGLKDVIVSMDQEFPSVLCSFKQGFAAIDKLSALEARQNDVDITFLSKISEAENFMDEAQQKEVVLKEKIKVCEAALSSLEEEKNKCILETIQYKKELENVRKDRSQMVEGQRKVRQELFEVAYKWSALCSQFKYNYVPARNLS